MQQQELATLLGVSAGMVSRHVKKGMPTDTLERAEKWRRRHLEPGRVKGVRYEPKRIAKPTLSKPVSPARAVPGVTVADVEVLADLTDAALTRGNQDVAETTVKQLRGLLKQIPDDASPRFTLRVWLALVIYLLHEEAEIRHAPDLGTLLNPGEFGARVCLLAWPAHVVLFEACDWDDNAINGFPECADQEN